MAYNYKWAVKGLEYMTIKGLGYMTIYMLMIVCSGMAFVLA